ncbi:MAG: SprT-like domain-containing protein [Flavobacteriaceae bacterium]|nr:SprT-like domain-containing protein [Flavobacteriaceae bacterium]
MKNQIYKYIPEAAFYHLETILKEFDFELKITAERKSKRGDFRVGRNQKMYISVNGSLNKYEFLITFIHEIAHMKAYLYYGNTPKPHGEHWKKCFQDLINPFMNERVFPLEILLPLVEYMINPKASTVADSKLYIALKGNNKDDKKYVFELIPESLFFFNDIKYKILKKRRTWYECQNIEDRKVFLFKKTARVIPVLE